jgi:hypothetical protein
VNAIGARRGNRCGHDPRRPRLALLTAPPTRGNFPRIISTAIDRTEEMYTDRSLFPELGERKRSERIEAMVLIAKCLLRNTDRLTLRSGRRLACGEFTGISVTTLAKWAGLELTRGRRGGRLVPQRAYRAIWDLRDAGWLRCRQPIEERADGSRRGLAGIRQWTRAFFERLRLGGRLRRERAELYQTQRQAHQETIAERRRLRRLHRSSERAATLARRAVRQLADAHVPVARIDEDARKAEIARQLAAWQARQSEPPER